MRELLLAAGDWWLGTALGGGLVLLVGYGLMRLARQPAAKQRLGEYAVLAALLVAVLRLLPAWLPLPWSAGTAVAAVDPNGPAPVATPEVVWMAVPPVEDVWVARPEPSKGVGDSATPFEDSGRATQSWSLTWQDVSVWVIGVYLTVVVVLLGR